MSRDDLINDMKCVFLEAKITNAQKLWLVIKPLIVEASKNGRNSLHLDYGITQSEAKFLEEAGFSVDTDRGDYTTSGSTNIHWV